MSLPIITGLGKDCKPTSGLKFRADKPHHAHLDACGSMRVFDGDAESCNDYRKARTLSDLQNRK